LDLVPIEAMVLVEARVLGGDHGVLQMGRDLAERKEFIAFVIRSAVSPGLQAALDVHGGGRRVDPAGGDEDEGGNRPEKREADDDPFENGSKRALTTQVSRGV